MGSGDPEGDREGVKELEAEGGREALTDPELDREALVDWEWEAE